MNQLPPGYTSAVHDAWRHAANYFQRPGLSPLRVARAWRLLQGRRQTKERLGRTDGELSPVMLRRAALTLRAQAHSQGA